ncbi:MAG: hypothetical protein R6U50_12140 [Desulfobacterales bacterium]
MKRTGLGRKIRAVSIVLIFSLTCLVITGCAGRTSKLQTGSSPLADAKNDPAPRYYDFTDILVPGGLNVNDRSTYVVKTSGFATGILVLDGWIKRNELIAFFQANMVKDNWEAVSTLKSPRTSTFLLFKKPHRWCIISIGSEDFPAHVEIGVAPAGERM